MKNKTRFIFFILFILSIPVNSFSQEFKKIRDGIEYAQFTRQIKDEPVAVSALRLDLKKVRLDVVHAFDRAVGLETTSSIAARKGALAAINAGFFRLDKSGFAGDAAGILQIDGRLLSESLNDRIAIMITNGEKNTGVVFNHLKTATVFRCVVDFDSNVTGINRERKKGDEILYTPDFGPSTLTEAGGVEIVLSKIKCENKIRKVCEGKIIALNEGSGNSAIPPGGAVVSLDRDVIGFEHLVNEFKYAFRESKRPVRIISHIFAANADNGAGTGPAEDIVSGRPQLIKNGRVEITWEQEKLDKAFVETRHPRTAAARLKDGRFLLITADGRQPGYSVGMSLPELAEMLLEMGAVEAINLDGGGSTTMFLDGKVVNKPSDKEGERKISDAILVFPRKK